MGVRGNFHRNERSVGPRNGNIILAPGGEHTRRNIGELVHGLPIGGHTVPDNRIKDGSYLVHLVVEFFHRTPHFLHETLQVR